MSTADRRAMVERPGKDPAGAPPMHAAEPGALGGLPPQAAPHSPASLKPLASRFRWTDAGASWATFSSNACGRSIKYEEVHLKAYADGREARARIGSWMTFYNFRRPHQAMNNQIPMAAWLAGTKRGGAKSCGYAASLGLRKRVAHLSTVEAEATRGSLIFEGQRQARLHPSHRGPTNGVHLSGPFRTQKRTEIY